jgi:hypothetical protein
LPEDLHLLSAKFSEALAQVDSTQVAGLSQQLGTLVGDGYPGDAPVEGVRPSFQ